jgi:DGQHR domain-containing protein
MKAPTKNVTKKKASSKPKPSPEELKKKELARKAAARKRQHIRAIRETFINSGFTHLPKMSSSGFTFKGRECDFDEVFVCENVLVILEHTSHNDEQVATHLLKKSIVFGYINGDNAGFVDYVKSTFSDLKSSISPKYNNHQIQVRVVYCSMNPLKESTKAHVPATKFLDAPHLKYLHSLSKIVKLSNRFELLDFLGVSAERFGSTILSSGTTTGWFNGFVLPEDQSHFPPQYKIVSFYISAGALMRRAYVLRRNSWRVGANIYQRILLKKKVDAIRRHLTAGKGAFVNNIIVALPEATRITDGANNQILTTSIHEVTPARIHIPEAFNSVSLIDGQHRVFSYFEGGADEDAIAILREQQNLLVTGIMMPAGTKELARDRFAAGIFLQINATQTSAKPELIQDIGVILRPFANTSIARRVLWKLNERGALRDQFQSPFSEGEKVKTASVVNYGLAALIKVGAEDSLYAHWNDAEKATLVSGQTDDDADEAVVERYVEFCTTEVNKFVGAMKVCTSAHRWTASRKVADRLLTTLIVNGMIHCLRRLCATSGLQEHAEYRAALDGVNNFKFSNYTSSHYNEMGLDLAKTYFGS